MLFQIEKSVVNLCCFAICGIHAVAAFGQIESQGGDAESTPQFTKEAHASTQYLHQIALANAEVLGKQFSVAEAILKKCPPELRRWEWDYLRRLSNPQITSYRVPNTGMWGVEYSPDGSMVATGGFREVHLWNASTGKRLHLWKPKKGWVSSVAFSSDGKRVASVSFQGGNVWDTESGEELIKFEGHERLGYCIDFSPDGSFIATGGNSAEAEFATKGAGVTKVWDAETGELRFQLYQKTPVVDLQYSPDGRWIATVSGKSSYTESKYPSPFNIWDAKTGELVHELEGHEVWQSCLAFSPDAQRLVVGGNDGNVRVWDLKTRKLTHVMSGHKRHLTGVAFTPDGSKVLSTSDDTEVRLWDAQTGKLIEVIAGPRGKISGMAISPDGRSFVTAVEFGKERGAKVWKLPAAAMSRGKTRDNALHSVRMGRPTQLAVTQRTVIRKAKSASVRVLRMQRLASGSSNTRFASETWTFPRTARGCLPRVTMVFPSGIWRRIRRSLPSRCTVSTSLTRRRTVPTGRRSLCARVCTTLATAKRSSRWASASGSVKRRLPASTTVLTESKSRQPTGAALNT